MTTPLDLASVAALVGDPARANILCALMDGRALTATELAYAARVAPQTASGHLGKLSEAGLVAALRQGRFRYYRLAHPQVGRMLEGIMNVAAMAPPRRRPLSKAVAEMRTARLCYDHCAGLLGVGLSDALCRHGHMHLDLDGGLVTAQGEVFLTGFGVEVAALREGRRVFCKPCLDWSERRPHLAGALGAALARRLFTLGWIERQREGRALTVTRAGTQGLRDVFGLSLADPAAERAASQLPAAS